MSEMRMTAGADAAPIAALERETRNRTQVRYWLYFMLATLFALVLLGGATRLTDSGLSITEWKPIHGVIPPLSQADWDEEFAKYKQIPEYQQINKGMTLSEFKAIFWWEWSHRLLARSVGFFFALPLAYFWLTGKLERRIKSRLLGILALGGLQGAIGWWMVASGLTERTDVSQYRLAIHLVAACLIFIATMVVARGLAPHSAREASDTTRRGAGVMVLLALIQIYLGALVAGLDAGLVYNTWPLMDGAWVPGDLFLQKPWWINLFENIKTVQYVHRIGAYVLLGAMLWHVLSAQRHDSGTAHAKRAAILLLLVLAQVGLGVATLLTQVDMPTALTHQGLALIVLGFAAAHWRGTRGAYAPQTEVEVRS